VPIQNGDRILLCSDGLTGAVQDEQLCNEIASGADVQSCAERLGQIALDQGSRDNVSCILLEVVEG
ncbi:MAG TPA: serine/threonine-protein phosphatase, partial [Gemmataceae bacterium]|nr:serine/threonine-protein phosphatase [Gemmataceae bacterium]